MGLDATTSFPGPAFCSNGLQVQCRPKILLFWSDHTANDEAHATILAYPGVNCG